MSLAQRQDVNLWPAKPFASEGLQRGNEEPGGGVGPEGSGENDGADEHGDSGEERGDDVDEDAGDGDDAVVGAEDGGAEAAGAVDAVVLFVVIFVGVAHEVMIR